MTAVVEVVVVRESDVSAPRTGPPDPRAVPDLLAPSADRTIVLLGQHMACRRSGRLPGLILSAARRVVGETGRRLLPWPDQDNPGRPDGAGDTGFVVEDDDRGCTVYEMHQKGVTVDDLDRAVQRLAARPGQVDNYVVITTGRPDPSVAAYAATLYEATGGTEFAVLDCLGFARYFLHLFHRHRAAFLEAYQELVLGEPESAVSFDLKQAFLALRRAATPTADP